MYLAPFDVFGSLAHIQMLQTINLLSSEELKVLQKGLREIYRDIEDGAFVMEAGVEDIHSQVEILLTKKFGDTGKKIHSARSRNDQVLVDLKLYMRYEIQQVVLEAKNLFDLLLQQSDKFKDHLMPGYTHLQLAMPSSFGLWFGAYAESLADDMVTLHAAWEIVNKNPLGSAAGFGSSFPIDRNLTTQLLGFEELNYNVVYAQMSRGKTERIVTQALANVAATLARLSMDACLYLNQNFGFISFPDELTTGSSIMPHKKNPDVFELIRARCNRIQSIPNELSLLINNLPSGYHRDLQLTKEILFPAIEELKACLQMTRLMLSHMEVRDAILDDEKYKYLFSVEAVNELVNKGIPFREAYKEIGNQIDNGAFHFDYRKQLHHTHEGSIGNLSNDKIAGEMEK